MAPVCTALVFGLSPPVDQLFSPALQGEVICFIALQVILCFHSYFSVGLVFLVVVVVGVIFNNNILAERFQSFNFEFLGTRFSPERGLCTWPASVPGCRL